jgi:hypothetical protein
MRNSGTNEGISGDYEWGNVRDDITAGTMWMVSETGAAILDAGLIYASGLTRLAVTEGPLTPVPGHIAFLCPTIANDRLLKLSEWLGNEFGYPGKTYFSSPRKENGLHDIVHAEGKWAAEFKRLEGEKPLQRAEYENFRKHHPKLPPLVFVELGELIPMQTDLSKIWMDLLGVPFVAFDTAAREKLIEGLPPKYRDWFGKWQRFLAGPAQ